MASKRFITTALWGHEDIQELTGIEKLVFIYLCTAPDSAMCGYYRCTPIDISRDIAFSTTEVLNALEVLETRGLIIYDKPYVLVINMWKQQASESLYTFNSHCLKQCNDLNKPGNRAFDAFYCQFKERIELATEKKKNRKSNKINDENLKPTDSLPVGHKRIENREQRIEKFKKEGEEKFENLPELPRPVPGIPEFKPPTEQEVIERFKFSHCKDPELQGKLFFSSYQSQGWIRANNIPIRDWVALVQKWIITSQSEAHKNKTSNSHSPPATVSSAPFRGKRQNAITPISELING